IDKNRIEHIPNLFSPSQEILSHPINTNTKTVSFVGRLEVKKGVLDLASAIPEVANQIPEVKFRFIGRSCPSPSAGIDMKSYLLKKYRNLEANIEFVDHVSPGDLIKLLGQTDICVFPSIWENF